MELVYREYLIASRILLKLVQEQVPQRAIGWKGGKPGSLCLTSELTFTASSFFFLQVWDSAEYGAYQYDSSTLTLGTNVSKACLGDSGRPWYLVLPSWAFTQAPLPIFQPVGSPFISFHLLARSQGPLVFEDSAKWHHLEMLIIANLETCGIFLEGPDTIHTFTY